MAAYGVRSPPATPQCATPHPTARWASTPMKQENTANSKREKPALRSALSSGLLERVEALLAEDAYTAVEPFWDHEVEPPLCYAISECCGADIIDSLLRCGADANMPDRHGRRPLELLVAHGKRRAVSAAWAPSPAPFGVASPPSFGFGLSDFMSPFAFPSNSTSPFSAGLPRMQGAFPGPAPLPPPALAPAVYFPAAEKLVSGLFERQDETQAALQLRVACSLLRAGAELRRRDASVCDVLDIARANGNDALVDFFLAYESMEQARVVFRQAARQVAAKTNAMSVASNSEELSGACPSGVVAAPKFGTLPHHLMQQLVCSFLVPEEALTLPQPGHRS